MWRAALAVWWISGGVFGLMSLGVHYCGGSLAAAWHGGMEAVVALPEWEEVLERNPANRERFLPRTRRRSSPRWSAGWPSTAPATPTWCPASASRRQGPRPADARVPQRRLDIHHTRATSERVAAALPNARLVEPPWGDREWIERQEDRTQGLTDGLFVRWPLLVPQLTSWADEVVV